MFSLMGNKNLLKKDLEYAKERLLIKFPLLGTTLANVDIKLTSKVYGQILETACTDNKNIYISPDFFKNLNDNDKIFVLSHELMHIAFNHIQRGKNRNKDIWNIATDAVINQLLQKENLNIIDNLINIPEAINKSAEEMYEKLLKEQENKPNEQMQVPKNHKIWEKVLEDQESQQGKQNSLSDSQQGQDQESRQGKQNSLSDSQQGQNQESRQGKQNSLSDSQQGQDQESRQGKQNSLSDSQQEQDQESQQGKQNSLSDSQQGQNQESQNKKNENSDSKEYSNQNHNHIPSGDNRTFYEDYYNEYTKYEKYFFEKNSAEKEKIAKSIQNDIKEKFNNAKQNIKDLSDRSFGNVGEPANAPLNWKTILKKSLYKEETFWSYRRSNSTNNFMPRTEDLEREEQAKTEVIIDISASVESELLREFLRQLKPLLKETELKVGFFSDVFYPFQTIKSKNDINKLQIPSAGGTNWDLAAKSFSKDKNSNKIIFTDGELPGTMPDESTKNEKIIWLVYGKEPFYPVCGKVIRVKISDILTSNLVKQR